MKIKVNGSDYLFFNDITITLNLDAVASSFSFEARFNPNNRIHRELFRPLGYPTVEIFDNDDILLLTGTVVNQNHKSTAEPNLITVSGYSIPGILQDCTIPTENYPLESLKRSLKDIALRLLSTFDIQLNIAPAVSNEANSIYQKTTAEPGDTISGYLAKLASQKNIVLGHDEKGAVLLYRPNANAQPRQFFEKGRSVSMGWTINGQGLHSSIEVIRQPSEENPGVSLQDRANNPLIGTYRPVVNVLSSGKETDTKRAADNKRASELSNLTLAVSFEKYTQLRPGDIVEVQNDEVYLYQRTRFMISKLTIKESETGFNTNVELVLPETYTGETPKNIFT